MHKIVLLAVLALCLNVCQACWKPANDHVAPNPPKDTFTCDDKTAKSQIRAFLAQLKRQRHSSACAEHWWLGNLAEIKLKEKHDHTAIADVGCNKAYFSATALNYLAPGYGNHLQLFFKHHSGRTMYAKPCGGCNECRQKPPARAPAGAQAVVDVFCFEPSEVHVASLTLARDALYGTPENQQQQRPAGIGTATRVNFHVRQAAVSNTSGVAHFPVNCTGNTCSLSSANTTFQAVKVTTVDAEIRSGMRDGASAAPFLDVLKIDTEGFDPAVLAGAYDSLKGRRIGLVSFEYHSLWRRSGGTLRQCVRYLDELGYACFYDGPTLAKISGGCWRDGYELRRWTNVVCVARGTPMEEQLNNGSYLGAEAAVARRDGGKGV